jgi:cytochrome c553
MIVQRCSDLDPREALFMSVTAMRFRFPLVLLALGATGPGVRAEDKAGAQLYKQLCAQCHGSEGEGTKKIYPKALAGNWPLERLTRYVAESMPDDNPGSLQPAEAKQVAAYIFDAFYSPAAQARQKPPRIDLARLTVRQYRNVMADLIAGFRGATPVAEGPGTGLRGEYFKGKIRGFKKGDAAFTRVDPVIKVDLSTGSPDAKKLDADEFSVRWEGSLLAPETGEYEFMVRTDQSGRLWVNDIKQPLIDASVKSGKDTEYRGSIYLLAGRLYPLRLEFFRSTLGVQKKEKAKAVPIQASFALEWKRPQRAFEVIAQRHLYPSNATPVLVVRTPFPPDDRSAGYERGTAVSKGWLDATTEGALEVAAYVTANLTELAGAPTDGPARQQALRTFASRFAERAFRRPLTDDQKRIYVDHQFESAPDPETAVKRSILLALKSPWFLYRELPTTPSSSVSAFDTAARISFALWDSLPDAELSKAAAANQVASREQIGRQAERMLKDPRARTKIHEFFLGWLKVEMAGDLVKDAKRYPGFDLAAAADLRTSLELFLDEVIWSDASDFRQLLRADHIYVNGRLAKFYNTKRADDADFEKVKFPANQRAGVLTHPYLMATFSYPRDSSPIHRGVFLARSVLGLPLRPPPDAFTPLPAELHPNLTTRERVALQTKPQACQSCHAVINPLGFILERYDAIGRFRVKEQGKPIDTTGTYETRDGKSHKFSGVRALAEFLAGSDEVHEAFVAQFFHHLVKQPIRAYGTDKLNELHRYFDANACNIRKLIVEIVAQAAAPPPAEQAANRPADDKATR